MAGFVAEIGRNAGYRQRHSALPGSYIHAGHRSGVEDDIRRLLAEILKRRQHLSPECAGYHDRSAEVRRPGDHSRIGSGNQFYECQWHGLVAGIMHPAGGTPSREWQCVSRLWKLSQWMASLLQRDDAGTERGV